jgi:uncharacterized membrane protein
VLGVENDPVMMPFQIILNPLRVFEALTYDVYLKLLFIVFIFGSLLFLSFRSSIVLITLAWLGPALLSNHQTFYVIGDHYPLYFIPFVFLAAVDGVRKQIPTLNVTKLAAMTKNLLVVGVIFWLFVSPVSPFLNTTNEVTIPHFSEYHLPIFTDHIVRLQRIVDLVPSNASILTQNNIFPHFSNRGNAYVVPLPQAAAYAPEAIGAYLDQLIDKSEYVLIDTKTDFYEAGNLILNRTSMQNFRLLANEDGILLYKRG